MILHILFKENTIFFFILRLLISDSAIRVSFFRFPFRLKSNVEERYFNLKSPSLQFAHLWKANGL